jgi:hypothetical protein
VLAATPRVTTVGALYLVYALTGWNMATLDTGAQILIRRLHGEREGGICSVPRRSGAGSRRGGRGALSWFCIQSFISLYDACTVREGLGSVCTFKSLIRRMRGEGGVHSSQH